MSLRTHVFRLSLAVVAVVFPPCGGPAAQGASDVRGASDVASPSGGIATVSTKPFVARVGADHAEQPIVGWTFEPVGWARDVGRRRILRVGPEGDASIEVPDAGAGVVLRGSSATARGDLVSPSFAMQPFRWAEIEVEYAVESGAPILFVGLRPTADRARVNLDFLPAKQRSKAVQTARLRLHSGSSPGPYSIAISISGIGAARVVSIRAEENGVYQPPKRPLCIIDIRTTKPSRRPSENFTRVASVFGFPSVEYLHFTEFEMAKLEAIDPALIVLPGLISLKGADDELLDAVVREAVGYDAPVVGVCLGHQVLARAHGAKLERGDAEWGPTKIDVVRNDPVFDGLPRRSDRGGHVFHSSQSHRFQVVRPVGKMQLIASSEACKTQVFRYRGEQWYTFQGHIERGWEVASPEACLLWKNMLRRWDVID